MNSQENLRARDMDAEPLEDENEVESGPLLSLVSLVAGALSLACSFYVHWMAGTLIALAAIVTGALALKRNAAHPVLAKLGIALGVACMIVFVVLVGLVAHELSSLGVL